MVFGRFVCPKNVINLSHVGSVCLFWNIYTHFSGGPASFNPATKFERLGSLKVSEGPSKSAVLVEKDGDTGIQEEECLYSWHMCLITFAYYLHSYLYIYRERETRNRYWYMICNSLGFHMEWKKTQWHESTNQTNRPTLVRVYSSHDRLMSKMLAPRLCWRKRSNEMERQWWDEQILSDTQIRVRSRPCLRYRMINKCIYTCRINFPIFFGSMSTWCEIMPDEKSKLDATHRNCWTSSPKSKKCIRKETPQTDRHRYATLRKPCVNGYENEHWFMKMCVFLVPV